MEPGYPGNAAANGRVIHPTPDGPGPRPRAADPGPRTRGRGAGGPGDKSICRPRAGPRTIALWDI
ncbi:hypothetical protein GCM10010245_10530 [Streptomyces spectabilis]|nr:hypothetical protein GCM10010245_10530 [Streptomyces spectabilis]